MQDKSEQMPEGICIRAAKTEEFADLTELWERSVRATHHFLPESEITTLKPLVRDAYLPQLKIYVALHKHRILGLLGVDEDKIEMLFIDADLRGLGVGKRLIQHAIEELGSKTVDVNEQNPQAVGFYLKMGFEVIGRSEYDGQGQPYPLLHLKLKAHTQL